MRSLETFDDVRLFVTEVRLCLEKDQSSKIAIKRSNKSEIKNGIKSELESIAKEFGLKYEIVEEIFHREDVKKRAAEIYKQILLTKMERKGRRSVQPITRSIRSSLC